MNEIFSLKQFGVSIGYERIEKLGDPLDEINKIINWNDFSKYLHQNKGVGRHGYDPIILFKMLFLQSCYGISDEELEYQVADRISFQKFLGFPNNIPDYSTVWYFREELSNGNTIDELWNEIRKQIENKGIKFSKGVIQDAKFIHADPGKKNSGMEDRGRGEPSSRNEDGSWTKKGDKNIFGYKLHDKIDKDNKFITRFAVTTAKTHDGNIDLAESNEINYRDRGYSGCTTKAKGDGTMKRGKLTPHEKLRNKRISKTRSRVEHPYAFMDRTLNAGYTKLTEIHRVFVQQAFVCIAYNLHRLNFLLKKLVA